MSDYMVVDPLTVKVKDGLPRLRQDMGKIKELVESFKKFGQLQAIVCNRDMELIAGGRRLAACIDAEMDVKVIFADTLDPVVMREMELEENIQRKALTPAEEINAVAELHKLKQTLHGETTQGKEGGWTLENTASVIGRTRQSIADDITLSEALKDFPILATCKTKSDIRKAVKGLQRITESIAALQTYDKDMESKESRYEIHNADCVEFLKGMEDASVDVLFTDPPYGISIHETTIGIGGHTGSDVTTSGFKYEDGFEESMTLINSVAIESARIVKDTGFAFCFCAISNFYIVRSMFESAGWNCSQRPIIWIKNESGQNNAPSKWMSAAYEAMLFARKIDSRIVIEGKADWLQHPNVIPSMRIHQAEKPVPVIKELLSRVAMAGAVVLDPFAGSCATVEAAIELSMYPIAIEKLMEAYATGRKRIDNYLKGKGE